MSGAISIFQQTQIYIYVNHTFVSIAPITGTVPVGSPALAISATVIDWNGNPIKNTAVELTTSAGTILSNSVVNSDLTGMTSYYVSMPMPKNARVSYVTLQAKAGGPTLDVSLGYLVLTLQNVGPQISVGLAAAKGAGGMVFDKGANVTLSGGVFDMVGMNSTNLKVDTGAAQTITATPVGAGNKIWTLQANLGAALATGTHTVLINATDSLGVSNTLTLNFEVKEHKATSTLLPWVVAVIGWILFAVVLVMMMMARRPKATPEFGAGVPEVEKPEEAPKM